MEPNSPASAQVIPQGAKANRAPVATGSNGWVTVIQWRSEVGPQHRSWSPPMGAHGMCMKHDVLHLGSIEVLATLLHRTWHERRPRVGRVCFLGLRALCVRRLRDVELMGSSLMLPGNMGFRLLSVWVWAACGLRVCGCSCFES